MADRSDARRHAAFAQERVNPMRAIQLLISALGAILVGCSSGPYARPSPPAATPASVPARTSTSLSIGAEQAAVIRAYYDDGRTANGRGRGRNGGLPPGIAKNLQRGKPLPPGIAKQYLPPDLLAGLPPLSAGFEYVLVAGKLLLVEIATQVIHDVLLDAVLD